MGADKVSMAGRMEFQMQRRALNWRGGDLYGTFRSRRHRLQFPRCRRCPTTECLVVSYLNSDVSPENVQVAVQFIAKISCLGVAVIWYWSPFLGRLSEGNLPQANSFSPPLPVPF